jgi:TPR repeat protein
MAFVDTLVALASPRAALRRSKQLTEKGRATEAFRLLSRAAKAGIADAQYRVGRCYLEGTGAPPSRLQAARWLERAATQGFVEAQVLLSALYVRGLVNQTSSQTPGSSGLFAGDAQSEPDFESASKWAGLAASAGSAEGQALLAYVLTCGPGPMRDLEEGHRLYKKAADAGCPQGHLGYALSLARLGTSAANRRLIAEHLRHAADSELPTAIYLLGVFTERGVGVERNVAIALDLYRRAAEKGHRSAQARWGLALIEGHNGVRDPVTGESWLRQAALAGDAQAAYRLGDYCIRNGLLPPNYADAAAWYRRAGEAGHNGAARALSSLYLTGAGVPQDKNEAARWLRGAAEAGDTISQVDLANLVLEGGGAPEDPSRIAGWFQEAAAAGDLVAAFNLGVCFAKGIGVERDEGQAVSWLRRAAEGVAEAQYMYGRMLSEGRGVSCDLKEARAWLVRAANSGMPDAQAALAEMMLNGRGGPASTAAAIGLLEKAAAKKHSGAMYALGAVYAGGHGIAVNHELALRWFRPAAELGHGQAQMMLGRYLSLGITADPNPLEARLWLERAVAQGIAEAESDLAALN